jgi:hypothetical protein
VLALTCLAAFTATATSAENPSGPRFKVAWATYFGGSVSEQLREAIPGADGSVLVGGQTNSPDMPVTEGVVQPKYAGEPADAGSPGFHGGDCLLARLSADGGKLLFSTYFGGSKQERNTYGMALDTRGNIVICTMTRSADLATTAGAFQRRFGGGECDWMVAKLSPDVRRLLWCTYVGGSDVDFPRGGLALDAEDCVYVVGETHSKDFPTTPGAYQRQCRGPQDAAMVKLKADGSGLVFGTLLGGSDAEVSMGVRLDPSGNLHWAGHTRSADFPVTAGAPQPKYGGQSDCFLACLSPDASTLLYSTFLGGRGTEFAEHRLALAADGGVLLTGVTGSDDFPTTAGAFQRTLRGKTDGFLAKLAADRKSFAFSTLVGGSGEGEFFLMPTVGPQGNIYLVGQTGSKDFPVTETAVQKTYGGGPSDGALAVFSPDGSQLLYATYLGGSGEDLVRGIALGPGGEVWLVGSTSSPDFPATGLPASGGPGAFQPKLRGPSDGFVVKLVPAP